MAMLRYANTNGSGLAHRMQGSSCKVMGVPDSLGERLGVLAGVGVRVVRVEGPGVSSDTSAAPASQTRQLHYALSRHF